MHMKANQLKNEGRMVDKITQNSDEGPSSGDNYDCYAAISYHLIKLVCCSRDIVQLGLGLKLNTKIRIHPPTTTTTQLLFWGF